MIWLNQNGIGVLLDDYSARTFGQLAKRLQDKGTPAELLHEDRKAVEKRNWLANDYFWDRAVDFTMDEGRAAMIDELQIVNERFEALDQRLEALARNWRTPRGMTDEVVAETMERMRA